MINKLVEQIPTFPVGNELLQEATDAFALFVNANTELNHRRRELIKPDLHNDYKHLCSSSLAITDRLFGDDLPKLVKDLTEVNRVGKKVTTNFGSSSSRSVDARNSRNYRFSSSRGRLSSGPKAFFTLEIQQPTNKPSGSIPMEDNPRGGRRGVLPEKLGRGVRPASQNPYPIYDQNLRFSLRYL